MNRIGMRELTKKGVYWLIANAPVILTKSDIDILVVHVTKINEIVPTEADVTDEEAEKLIEAARVGIVVKEETPKVEKLSPKAKKKELNKHIDELEDELMEKEAKARVANVAKEPVIIKKPEVIEPTAKEPVNMFDPMNDSDNKEEEPQATSGFFD